MPQEDVTALARKVECLLMDVDGVLTDGRIWLVPGAAGDVVEAKAFDVTDGAGIALAHRAGLKTGIITARPSPAVERRAKELHMTHVYQGGLDKLAALEDLLAKTNLPPDRLCFIGDDVLDIPLLRRVGLPIAVANARPEVKTHAAYVTDAPGGRGAVREVVELILKAQGKWDGAIQQFLI